MDKSIDLITKSNSIISAYFIDGVNKELFKNSKIIKKIPFKKYSISESSFKQVVADVSYIDEFKVEVAKAMIIDSARGWSEQPIPEEVALYGHGIVPIKIDEILQTKEDEIKF